MSLDLSKHVFSARRLPLWIVLLVGLMLLAAGIGLRGPWPPDEPRFVLIAHEMLQTGHWLFPHRAGELYPDKPPVFFWALAASLWLTRGAIKVAHLLPSLVAGLGCLTLVYDLARRLYSHRVATMAALLLLFCVQFTTEMRHSQIDGFLSLWIVLGLYGICRHLLLGPAWGWYALGGFAMGIGIITKGVGFLPLFILLPYIAMRVQGGWQGLPVYSGRAWLWVLAPAFMLLGIALWVVPMLYVVGHRATPALLAYRDNILLHQTFQRYADAWHHFHPFWYYLRVIPLQWFPLSVLFIWLIPAWLRPGHRRDARIMLPLAWAVVVVVFFSVSHGKRNIYILPAIYGVVLAAAPLLPKILGRRSVRCAAFVCNLALGGALLAAAAYLGLIRPELGKTVLRGLAAIDPWLPLIALGAVFVVTAIGTGPRHGVAGAALGLFGFWMIFAYWVAPLVNPINSGEKLMTLVQNKLPENAELGMTLWKSRNILYAKRRVTQFGFHTARLEQVADSSAWLRQDPARRWILTTADGIEPCFNPNKALPLLYSHHQHWYLLNSNALATTAAKICRWPAPREEWVSAKPLRP